MNTSLIQKIKALLSLLPVVATLVPGLGQSGALLRFLPLLAPLLDEVDDLWEKGGLTRTNMEDVVQRGYLMLVALHPPAAKVDEKDLVELAGVMFEKIVKIHKALD